MSGSDQQSIRIGDAVQAALGERRGIVALETTLIVHGLPRPENLEIAYELEQIVAATGAVAATVGVLDGVPVVGLSPQEIEKLATSRLPVAKLSSGDLGFAVARGIDGATTVASTITLAAQAGVNVVATGGIGGVHRGAAETRDESADLQALHDQPVLVVCSGVKSVLDVSATLERLETLSVAVAGYRTDAFPGFYVRTTPHRVAWRLDSPVDAAAAFAAHRSLARTAMVLANAIPAGDALPDNVHAEALADAEERASAADVHGKAVTPFLLARFAEFTKGESVRANRTLVRANARLAGEIAVELAKRR
jgi:pseudouridine-5'-phosphate glycosidase